MEQETLEIYIGFDEKEAVVFHTCVQSIIEKCKVPVSIHPLKPSNVSIIIKKIIMMVVIISFTQDFWFLT